ncbi:MAG: hypothetical protein QXO30_04510 [Candidatus Caldarchaeum sp.]
MAWEKHFFHGLLYREAVSLPRLDDVLTGRGAAEGVEAAFYIHLGKTSELHVVLRRLRQGVRVLRSNGHRVYMVDAKAFEDDVLKAAYAETLAHRLLTALLRYYDI